MNSDECSGINGFVTLLFYTHTLYLQVSAGTSPCRGCGLAVPKASAACGAAEKDKTST